MMCVPRRDERCGRPSVKEQVYLRMRVLPGICRRLASLSLIFCSALAFGCDGLAAGQTLWIRLSAPVSSYSVKAGRRRSCRSYGGGDVCDNGVVFPVGTSIEGVVHSVRKVGWGIRHETAALDIRFDRAVVAQGAPVPISASVVEVENAREQVSKGVIQGIRSSDTPQGRINSRLIHLPTWNPYSDVGLIVYKATFPIFPEPEIYFPAGTDLRIKLTKPVHSLPDGGAARRKLAGESSAELDVERMAASLPRALPQSKLIGCRRGESRLRGFARAGRIGLPASRLEHQRRLQPNAPSARLLRLSQQQRLRPGPDDIVCSWMASLPT